MAKNLLKSRINVELVAQSTELTIEEIELIKESNMSILKLKFRTSPILQQKKLEVYIPDKENITISNIQFQSA